MDYQEFWHEPDPEAPQPNYVSCELLLATAKACHACRTCPNSACPAVRHAALWSASVQSILDPRRLIAFGDRCADNPHWWYSNRLHSYCPGMTESQIAARLGIRATSVRDYIRRVTIGIDVYDNLPEL